MNFSEAMFFENYLTSDFHTNTVISRRICLLVEMASKTVMRPIIYTSDMYGGGTIQTSAWFEHVMDSKN